MSQFIPDTRDFPDSPIKYQVNHIIVQFSAAKSGMGISTLPCFMDDPDDSLERLPGAKLHPSRDIWILTHRDLRHTARVRAFTDFMEEAILAHTDLLKGKSG